jgi:hypothetical protein
MSFENISNKLKNYDEDLKNNIASMNFQFENIRNKLKNHDEDLKNNIASINLKNQNDTKIIKEINYQIDRFDKYIHRNDTQIIKEINDRIYTLENKLIIKDKENDDLKNIIMKLEQKISKLGELILTDAEYIKC